MKKSILAASAAAAVLLTTGCGAGQPPSSAAAFGNCALKGDTGTISLHPVQSDTLVVATVLPNPGWWNGTSPDTVKDGFEYCMAADIAHRAGLSQVKVKNLAWDQFISGRATDYDIAMASVTVTDERQNVFNFSRPYFSSNLGVVTRADGGVTEENIHNAKIGAVQGNAGGQWVAKVFKPSTPPSFFQNQTDMLTALRAGQIDAFITDTTLALTLTKDTGRRFVVAGQYSLDQSYGIVTPLGSVNTAPVDQAVAAMEKDGTLDDLSRTYLKPMFGEDPKSIPFWSVK
ncbi:ABC transporter substrate-binding protein [Arthrobacter sp. NPDC057013]|uniref:ABC transporter substrate-binding protein n=2 Tax=Bacillati TaxID=1783272 RepID=UPI00364202F2